MNYTLSEAQLCLLELARGVWERRGTSKAAKLPISEETITEIFFSISIRSILAA
jgi:hypothetical protein